VHGEFADHRLAGTRWGADQYTVAAFEGLACPALEAVERERHLRGEPVEFEQLGHAAAG
jgi:hypothetical protein